MIEGKNIKLRLVDPADAGFILSLRTDTQKNKHLSAVDSDVKSQVQWIRSYKTREGLGEEYYYIIEDKNGTPFGTLRLYDFIGDSFCWGSWILKNGSPNFMSIESALLVYEQAYYRLGFEKCHFDVRKENARVVEFHKRFGAKIVREDELNYYFEFSKDVYASTRKKYRKYIVQG